MLRAGVKIETTGDLNTFVFYLSSATRYEAEEMLAICSERICYTESALDLRLAASGSSTIHSAAQLTYQRLYQNHHLSVQQQR